MNTRMPTQLTQTTQTGLSAQLPINKIVVVGHPLSGFETVESLLNRCGMQAAAPSQREGLSPVDIGATLLKAHRIVPLDALQSHGAIHSLQPGPVWQSLALDLLLGNIDHELWGWSDPQAVYLLDYWKGLDPQLAFMLVYDTPQDLIARAFDNPASPCTPEAVQAAVDNWQAYNEALLYFYHRNPQRCMLVHAAQVRESAADYLQQVQLRIGAPLGKEGKTEPAPAPPETTHTQDALRRYLAQHILAAHPQVLSLYEELQAVASLPKSAPTDDQAADQTGQALGALQSVLKQQQQLNASNLRTQAAQTRIQELEQEQAQLNQTRDDLEKIKQDTPSPAASQTNELQQENDLLLVQLHQVQEELERYYLENQRLKAKPAAPAKHAAPPAPYGAAERVKQQLSYRLGSKMIERSHSLGGWLGMPFALLGLAREYKRELPQRKASKQLPIEKYRDAYEAERMKQHLSYRLGAALIKHGKNPLRWPALPFALNKARQEWLRHRTG